MHLRKIMGAETRHYALVIQVVGSMVTYAFLAWWLNATAVNELSRVQRLANLEIKRSNVNYSNSITGDTLEFPSSTSCHNA